MGVSLTTTSPFDNVTSHGTTVGNSKTSKVTSDEISALITRIFPFSDPNLPFLIVQVPNSSVKVSGLTLVASRGETTPPFATFVELVNPKDVATSPESSPSLASPSRGDTSPARPSSSKLSSPAISVASEASAFSIKESASSKANPSSRAASALDSISLSEDAATAGTTGTREVAKTKEIATEDDRWITFFLEVLILNTSPE